jgi:hypothetical protein
MAKINYFQDMEQRYQSNGNESWLNLIKPADIQKSAVKRIFREMINGEYDYEKFGKYFLDYRFLENLIIAANNKVEYYTLLNNAISVYRVNYPTHPNIGFYSSHLQNLFYIYYTIYNKLVEVKGSSNISPLIEIAPILYPYRNDINNE